ncbi:MULTISPECIES: sigma factor G inhibitor Gin [Aneurinibacillus]|uniref:Inhibitor of sigma-G Gin n=1 Tax=Aneurinibacillus thermoaerophilus TaxID=143495 RepID=A0A1G8DNP5_ANETH|nr:MULTISPECIES: sigma factor G inhibitor Gin [Aneurinibacillus]AMA74543.1 inhibitor of sigma-G Gin [Aneurinibacillus sp. XH2]MED0675168.1 sigma factor G inhibitor Gin [Aneurinibacillus thermoaerophilus]MED0681222.1 sigma factor G inhibitor Gin [Aneurinibacillus thermoaerophilus]MED0738853.1 sigma factor G inhibitor Gin [Aneurinibacillus thermoaerophilus]MED0757699.1 sigma factor G inhibitor Gin [Aneurinibacillus thermoaerophilus]
MTEQEDHSCIVCGHEEERGIFIFRSFVCHRCEQEIIKTDASEDRYHFFIRQMRRIWLKQNA